MRKNLITTMLTWVILCFSSIAMGETLDEKIIKWKFCADAEQAEKDGLTDIRDDFVKKIDEEDGEEGKMNTAFCLGLTYYDGHADGYDERIEPNYKEAYKWFLKSLNRENKQNLLSNLYIARMSYNGMGTNIDYETAYKCALRAFARSRELSYECLRNNDYFDADTRKAYDEMNTETKQIINKILSSNLISKERAKQIQKEIEDEIPYNDANLWTIGGLMLVIICWMFTTTMGWGTIIAFAIGIGIGCRS